MRAIRRMSPPLVFWVMVFGVLYSSQFHWNVGQETLELDADPGRREIETATLPLLKVTLSNAQDYDTRIQAASERPLFSETRRIPVQASEKEEASFEKEMLVEDEEPVVVSHPYVEPPELLFKGYMHNGSEKIALLVSSEHSEERWIPEGGVAWDWSVVRVSPEFVLLDRSGSEFVVEVFK